MSVRPKDIDSLDYSDVDSLADYVCDAMFLDKNQHKEFFFKLFDKCRDRAYEDGSKDQVYDRDQVEKQSISGLDGVDEEKLFCSLPNNCTYVEIALDPSKNVNEFLKTQRIDIKTEEDKQETDNSYSEGYSKGYKAGVQGERRLQELRKKQPRA